MTDEEYLSRSGWSLNRDFDEGTWSAPELKGLESLLMGQMDLSSRDP